jgi:cytochrome c oxidase subunit III
LSVHSPAAPAHPAALLHQFDSSGQQKDASQIGMWLFLVQEIMFFGGLFTAYVVYRNKFYHAFETASNTLNLPLGAFNTAVLICSSLTMALGVHSAHTGRKKTLVLFLILTVLLGSTFLVVKYFEYSDKFTHHHVPGRHFEFHGADPQHAEIFFSLYFGMTGLHALHMIIGIAILFYLIGRAAKGWYTPEYFTPIEMFGLYWHFVDIVWIFLFPLLYLLGGHLVGGGGH